MSDHLDSILADFGVDVSDHSKTYHLSKSDIVNIVRGTVHLTLIEVGFKPHTLQSGKVYKKYMEKVLGIRGFQKAVKSGKLPVHKDGNRTSPVYAYRKDWELYKKLFVNKKI